MFSYQYDILRSLYIFILLACMSNLDLCVSSISFCFTNFGTHSRSSNRIIPTESYMNYDLFSFCKCFQYVCVTWLVLNYLLYKLRPSHHHSKTSVFSRIYNVYAKFCHLSGQCNRCYPCVCHQLYSLSTEVIGDYISITWMIVNCTVLVL